jgi:peroxiredoxin
MLPLGTKAPNFSLSDVVTGTTVALASAAGKNLLVMFICKHCPYVQHIKQEIGKLGNEYLQKGFAVIAISSNDADSYPDDSPASLKKFAEEIGATFPLLYDESQDVAKSYTAACTPDFFLFDKDHKLVYRGQLDDARPGNSEPVTGKDLRQALDALALGKAPDSNQRPSTGCNIKWKQGKEPKY